MRVPALSLLVGIFGIAFGLACGLSALAYLIYARSDHGFQRRRDIAYALFAGLLSWGVLSGSRQSFVYVSGSCFQSGSCVAHLFVTFTTWGLLAFALLYLSLRRITAAVRLLRRGV